MALQIRDLDEEAVDLIDQIAHILVEAFARFSPTWLPTLDDAFSEVEESFEPGRRSRVLVNEHDEVLGWVSAFEDEHCWEIHPLVVNPANQHEGLGTRLVDDICALARESGAVSAWLGTSDETGDTSLTGQDLYADPLTPLQTLTANPGRPIQDIH